MVIDTSAIVAILRDEPEAAAMERAIVAAAVRLVPATCALEARMVMVARRGEHVLAELDLWLARIGTDVVAVDADLADLATAAWLTYGKGRHPAALNFADCISYALARRSGLPLLFKGEDFSRTDVATVRF
ncbi:type II toxin-antitoxin system VapC family toxin [Oharaeibacter diazotrophicus]|uniref:Ribonuclease VapC n=1 Tax=Oharaeibacter diazotrophicus TaxID=1920512 RepID=A0A4R6R681_9HYPH|nr:type II toxin-antitoxin system VapC family toxin [Oharaeibacter diazotrophicus]TDP81155.1 ribonuclease VapC [Oharaeibacter diazotrophicus]BBE74851.1 ribonuclease VapC30 [Pleomorphomonas sp. SM30]GLS75645.1 ribonuclease VapC30 [Oharaeibacter diazotrophicus]